MGRFSHPSFKKIAHVVMGEPGTDYKAKIHQKLLDEKKLKAEAEWKAKMMEKEHTRAMKERQKQIRDAQKKAMEEKKKAEEEAKKKAEEEAAKKAEEEDKTKEVAESAKDGGEKKEGEAAA